MFGIGSTELVIILIVALVLIGPSKLPDLMKSVGKGLSEFRRMSTDVKSTLEREIEKADEAKRIEETKKELFGDDAKPAEAVADAAKPDAASPASDVASNASSEVATDTKVAATATASSDAAGSGQVATATTATAEAAAKPVAEAKPAASATDKSHA